MVTKFSLSVDSENSKSEMFQIEKSYSQYFRYTEIWSDKNGTKKIELAEPQLVDHFDYPELALVDTNFCVRR